MLLVVDVMFIFESLFVWGNLGIDMFKAGFTGYGVVIIATWIVLLLLSFVAIYSIDKLLGSS